MYFLLKMVIFHCYVIVYQRVQIRELRSAKSHFFVRNNSKSSKVASATPEETIPEMEEDMSAKDGSL